MPPVLCQCSLLEILADAPDSSLQARNCHHVKCVFLPYRAPFLKRHWVISFRTNRYVNLCLSPELFLWIILERCVIPPP